MLFGVASVAPTAGAATTGSHGDALLAKQSATTAKKKNPVPPTIKMQLLGSVAPESPENANEQRGWLYTDGARWAAFEPTAGTTRLIETIKNKTIERLDPQGCSDGLIALGGGEMLYICEDPECPEHERRCSLPSNNKFTSSRYVTEDIVSGEQHLVVGDDMLPNYTPEGGLGGLERIGSQWAKGGIGGHAGGNEFFLDWRTGRLVWEREEASENNIEDLSSAGLTQRLCKPITRPKNKGNYQSVAYSPLAYEPPFAIVGPLEPSDLEIKVALQIRKCGSGKRMLPPDGSGVQLGARILSWVGDGAYVTQLFAKGREWHGPYYKLVGLPSEVGGKISFVQHTSNVVFATSKSEAGIIQVYSAHLPRTRKAQ